MRRLDLEALMTIKTLKNRTAKTEIARLLQVTEGAVRYHVGRMEAGAVDGRSRQMFKAEAVTEAIESWRSQHVGPLNLGDLHDWLRREHVYDGSLRSGSAVLEVAIPGAGGAPREGVSKPQRALKPKSTGPIFPAC